MFNKVNDTLTFLTDDDEVLTEGFHNAIDKVNCLIGEVTGYTYESYQDVRYKHSVIPQFAAYFHQSLIDQGILNNLTKEDIQNSFAALCSPAEENPIERTKAMSIIRKDNDPRNGRLKTGHLMATGLRLVFMAMRVAGLVLLPLNFKLPYVEGIHTSAYKDSFYTPLGLFFLSFLKDSPKDMKGSPAYEYFHNSRNSKRLSWFGADGVSISLCISANKASELDINDLVQMHYWNKAKDKDKVWIVDNFSHSGIQWNLIYTSLEHEYSNELSFKSDEVLNAVKGYRIKQTHNASMLSRKNPNSKKTKQKTISICRKDAGLVEEELVPIDLCSLNNDELYAHCIRTEARYFSPSVIKQTIQHVTFKTNEEVIEYWCDAVKYYLAAKHKKTEKKEGLVKLFGNLFQYLFFYLPNWFENNKTNKLSYPVTFNDFIPEVFGSQIVEPDYSVPKSYVQYMTDKGEHFDWMDSTLYNYLLVVHTFFEWVAGKGKRYISDCDQFEIPYDRDDLPRSGVRSSTSKAVFPKRLFKTVASYSYGILEFYRHLYTQLHEGKLHLDDLPKQGTIINPADYGIVPKVFHNGKELEITQIPLFITILKDLEFTDKITRSVIHLGPITHNILALETGLRGRHILWLDETSFDSFVDDESLSREIYPLFVNTDKRGHQWTPYVSRRVIALLRQQREWKESIADPKFHIAVEYTHEKSHYGKIHPVFSTNTSDRPGPFNENSYRKSWAMLNYGFQLFAREYEISDMIFCRLLPTGVKEWKHRYKKDQIDIKGPEGISWADGHFCPVTLRSYITPHGARATVVSNNISIIPADLIGKYITGQTERVVAYYAKINLDDLNEIASRQSDNIFSVGNAITSKINAVDSEAIMLHCNEQNSKLALAIKSEDDVDSVIRAFGLISLGSLSDKKHSSTGIEILKNSRFSELAYNEAYICPFGNTCPTEVHERFSETGLCGICPYSIKSIDHLPAIAGEKKAALERLEGLTKTLKKAYKSKSPDSEIFKIEQMRDNQALNALGWELSEEILYAKLPEIRDGLRADKYVSFEPEFVSDYIERVHLPSDETNYLICRLRECVEYPTLETPHIAAKFEKAKRKLLASTGRLMELFEDNNDSDPAADLYSLITTIKETKQLSTAQILSIIRSDFSELLAERESQPKLLEIDNV